MYMNKRAFQSLLQFLKLKPVWYTFFFFISLEIVLQTGFYQFLYTKKSYAYNVVHVKNSVIHNQLEFGTNALIVGTSIAYEGLDIKQLNEKLKSKNLKFQSIAIPGSELIVQKMVLKEILDQNPNIKLIVHINDIQMPWIDRIKPIEATLSMISDFRIIDKIKNIKEDEYQMELKDWAFLLVKTFSIRNDLSDLIISPLRRIKEKIKNQKNFNLNYPYTNTYTPSIALYNSNNVSDCVQKSSPTQPIPIGSDQYHRDAVFRTCSLVNDIKLETTRNQSTEIYKKRLNNLYHLIKNQNIRFIQIYPPVSKIMDWDDYQNRKNFWENEFKEIMSYERYDLSNIFPEESNELYYYDIIHLNKDGMLIFTEKLSELILQKF
jgi:hypothetical protein